jgi:hypothetical protein
LRSESTSLDKIAYSRAVGRPFASDTATTYNGKTYTRPGLIFGENANLDPQATELVSILKRVKRAAEQYANLKGREPISSSTRSSGLN